MSPQGQFRHRKQLRDRGPEAVRLAGIPILTVLWWIVEPIPLAAIGLLAIVLCVILGAVPAAEQVKEGVRTVLAPFADPAAFFLLGRLFAGGAMTEHGLDRRVALTRVGRGYELGCNCEAKLWLIVSSKVLIQIDFSSGHLSRLPAGSDDLCTCTRIPDGIPLTGIVWSGLCWP